MGLVAIDIEGSGAQDHENEAILEIALVPIIDWQPEMSSAYRTLINSARPIPRRRWISPGLTNDLLRNAPTLTRVEPELARRINGSYLVGHNIGIDWRLLHLRCPNIAPAGLIDTLRLARLIDPGGRNSLSVVVERFGLTEGVNRLATGSAPHRALWDTVAAAMLLPVLARPVLGWDLSIGELLAAAGVPVTVTKATAVSQPTLFD